MEIRVAAILGIISAGLSLLIHLLYFVLGFAQRSGGFNASYVYSILQGIGILPSIGYLACFIFFLIGFNKLLAPAPPPPSGQP